MSIHRMVACRTYFFSWRCVLSAFIVHDVHFHRYPPTNHLKYFKGQQYSLLFPTEGLPPNRGDMSAFRRTTERSRLASRWWAVLSCSRNSKLSWSRKRCHLERLWAAAADPNYPSHDAQWIVYNICGIGSIEPLDNICGGWDSQRGCSHNRSIWVCSARLPSTRTRRICDLFMSHHVNSRNIESWSASFRLALHSVYPNLFIHFVCNDREGVPLPTLIVQ